MKMKDFHCTFLELMFRVKPEDVDKDALLKEIETQDKEGRESWVFDSREAPNEQHSHVNVHFRPNNQVRLTIEYFSSGGNIDESKAPSMEDCAKWIGGFIKVEEVPVHINATYNFGKDYSFRVALPFPLVGADEQLSGSQVTGLVLKFPESSIMRTVFVENRKGATTVSLHTDSKVNLKTFDLYNELERLAAPVMSLLKEQERPRDGDNVAKGQ